MRTCITILSIVMLLFSTWPGGVSAHNTSATRVKETAEKTVGIDVDTQNLVEDWAQDKQDMLNRIETLSSQLKQAQWQQKKNIVFIRTLEEKIASLNQRAAEIKKVELELLPVLDATLEQVNSLGQSNMPANQERRKEAIAHTRSVLDDYDMDLLTKARTLFDLMSREVDLGYTVGVEEKEITADGQARQVKLLRVGRIGLFAVTLDGRKGFVWDRSTNQFTALEGSAKDLSNAVEMAEGIRLIGLSRLPLDLPEAKMDEPLPEGDSLAGNEQMNGGDRGELN